MTTNITPIEREFFKVFKIPYISRTPIEEPDCKHCSECSACLPRRWIKNYPLITLEVVLKRNNSLLRLVLTGQSAGQITNEVLKQFIEHKDDVLIQDQVRRVFNDK